MKQFNLLLILLLAGGFTACGPAATAALSSEPTAVPVASATAALVQPVELPALPEGALFQVLKPDGSTVSFTLDDLNKMPLAQLFAEGKMEEGPALVDVLEAAGVTDYISIHLEGSSSPADLTREQVEAGAILDFNNHGTVKLSSKDIPKANWTKDVSLIEVR
jgi:hypothetical protein